MEQRHQRTVLFVGKESTGKSQLIASLTGRPAHYSNFRGSTVDCQQYALGDLALVDAPGILLHSDSDTTVRALNELDRSEAVALVLQATHLDEDIADLLPLVAGRQVSAIVTFWDKIRNAPRAAEAIDRLSRESGVSFTPVDARALTSNDRERILHVLSNPSPVRKSRLEQRSGWQISAPESLLGVPLVGPIAAALLLLAPALLAVWLANGLADRVDPLVKAWLAPAVELLSATPLLAREILVGRYGLLTMGPLLFVWAVPTVVLYALLLGAWKASGLIDAIAVAVQPFTRRVGLNGRDVARIIMGFGCNVPAVISTRACSACSRLTCIQAIGFGSACSYQFGATLGVLSKAGRPELVVPYLGALTLATIVYTRLVSTREARDAANRMVVARRTFLAWPRPRDVWREARGMLVEFFRKAVPIFLTITVIASVIDAAGMIDHLAGVLGVAMAGFRLPADTALPIVLSAIRKDGILLLADSNILAGLSASQLLTALFLAGVLTPCLVTLVSIAREVSVAFAGKLLARQATAAVVASTALAWAGWALGY